MGNPENSPTEPPKISGTTLALYRQIYQLAKKRAPGFSFDQIPANQLAQFQAEEQPPSADKE